MAGFDDIPDPADTNEAAFPGTSQAALTLFDVNPILTAIPVKLGVTRHHAPGVPEIRIEEPEIVSYDKAATHIFDLDESQLSSLQKRMWEAGFFSDTTYKDGYQPGELMSGDDTERTWRTLVDTAAKSGRTIDELLDENAKRVADAGGLGALGKRVGGRGAAPESWTISSPVDLTHFANEMAKKLIGREMAPQDLNRFISSYQLSETKQATGMGATVAAPSIQSAAGAFIEAQHPAEVEAQRKFELAQVFLDAIRGGST